MDGHAWHKCDAVVTFDTYYACVNANGTVFGIDKDDALYAVHTSA
jgi:hypothetical protein